MHYIRLLRPPEIERHGGARPGQPVAHSLKIVLTITTDLSDAYLAPEQPVELAFIGASHVDKSRPPVPVMLAPARPQKWHAGIRVLKLDLPLPPQPPITTILIRPASRHLAALATADIYPGQQQDGSASQGLILPVYADILTAAHDDKRHVCFRSLRLPNADGSAATALQIEEELGESMARHVWDGGLTAVSMLADLCLGNGPLSASSSGVSMPMLSRVLQQHQRLNIMELGCGVGILGVGVARILHAASPDSNRASTRVLLTDLADARERARANIERCVHQAPGCHVDFESLDWDDGKAGRFGPLVQARPWDLVVLSDCTYNDLLSILVKTLSAIHAHSAQQQQQQQQRDCDTKVLLFTKPRHANERAVFDMLSADGWEVAEQTVVPLPVLYSSEPQTVEAYLFARRK